MDKRRVLFRVDASHHLGNGHVIRCLALAEALKDIGYSCTFACRKLKGNVIDWLAEQKIEVIALPEPTSRKNFIKDDYKTWAESDPIWDAQNSLDCLEEYKVDWLVVDHYAWSADEHIKLSIIAKKTLIMDDLCNRPIAADLIVDSGSHCTEEYKPWNSKSGTLLLGKQFFPLRKSFRKLRSYCAPVDSSVKHCLISCGATDNANFTQALLQFCVEKLKKFDVRLSCVLAGNAPHKDSVASWCLHQEGVRCIIDPPDMAKLIDSVSFAVGTAGSGIWERCVLSKPSAVFMAGADQKNNFNTLIATGAGVSIAQYKNPYAIDFNKVEDAINFWCAGPNVNNYLTSAKAAWELCDGMGATHIANAIYESDQL